MKEYEKPEIEFIDFSTEAIADVVDGETGVEDLSNPETNPFG